MADTDDFDAYIKQHAKEPGDHGTKDTYSDYIFEHVIKDHIKTLYAAQNRAARQAGFDKLYTNKALTDYESGAGPVSLGPGAGIPTWAQPGARCTWTPPRTCRWRRPRRS